ncbi:transmembrane 4 L6 family member 1 isoform 1-T2 [Menidia menidia]
MCVSGCLRGVGVALVPMATACLLANLLLLCPELSFHFLLEGHVTREATWAPGVWGSGLLVLLAARAFIRSKPPPGCCAFRGQMLTLLLFSCLGLVGGGSGFLVSATGLSQGPLCLHQAPGGGPPSWGVPLRPLPGR